MLIPRQMDKTRSGILSSYALTWIAKILLVCGLFSLGSCVSRWNATHTVLESANMVVLAVDYKQTKNFVKNCRELNPIMGECGKRIPPEVYFPVVAGLHVLTAILLPSDYRYIFQGFTLGLEMSTIHTNLTRADP